MPEPITVLIGGRILERLLIALVGGVCVVLGWKLFSLPLEHDGEADVRHRNFRLTLKRIGPGVFFALFGAAVLTTSLLRPLSMEMNESPALQNLGRPQETPAASAPMQRQMRFSGAGEMPGEAKAIETV